MKKRMKGLMVVLLLGSGWATAGYMKDDAHTLALWDMDQTTSSCVLDLNTDRANDLILRGGLSAFTFSESYDGTDAIYFNGTGGDNVKVSVTEAEPEPPALKQGGVHLTV